MVRFSWCLFGSICDLLDNGSDAGHFREGISDTRGDGSRTLGTQFAGVDCQPFLLFGLIWGYFD
jgi:hypothetical protein